MFLVALNAIVNFGGVWSYEARGSGLCCSMCLSCLNIGAIITIGIFRFNTLGKLAALSEGPSKYDRPFSYDDGVMLTAYLSDDHTFMSDGNLIKWLWICQMIGWTLNCCFKGYFAKLPSAEQSLRTNSVIAAEYETLKHDD